MEAARHWKHQLVEDYYDELEDVKKYQNLAKQAEEDSYYETARTLEVIAQEELTHAKFLRGKLEEWGIPHSAKESEWEELESYFWA